MRDIIGVLAYLTQCKFDDAVQLVHKSNFNFNFSIDTRATNSRHHTSNTNIQPLADLKATLIELCNCMRAYDSAVASSSLCAVENKWSFSTSMKSISNFFSAPSRAIFSTEKSALTDLLVSLSILSSNAYPDIAEIREIWYDLSRVVSAWIHILKVLTLLHEDTDDGCVNYSEMSRELQIICDEEIQPNHPFARAFVDAQVLELSCLKHLFNCSTSIDNLDQISAVLHVKKAHSCIDQRKMMLSRTKYKNKDDKGKGRDRDEKDNKSKSNSNNTIVSHSSTMVEWLSKVVMAMKHKIAFIFCRGLRLEGGGGGEGKDNSTSFSQWTSLPLRNLCSFCEEYAGSAAVLMSSDGLKSVIDANVNLERERERGKSKVMAEMKEEKDKVKEKEGKVMREDLTEFGLLVYPFDPHTLPTPGFHLRIDCGVKVKEGVGVEGEREGEESEKGEEEEVRGLSLWPCLFWASQTPPHSAAAAAAEIKLFSSHWPSIVSICSELVSKLNSRKHKTDTKTKSGSSVSNSLSLSLSHNTLSLHGNTTLTDERLDTVYSVFCIDHFAHMFLATIVSLKRCKLHSVTPSMINDTLLKRVVEPVRHVWRVDKFDKAI